MAKGAETHCTVALLLTNGVLHLTPTRLDLSPSVFSRPFFLDHYGTPAPAPCLQKRHSIRSAKKERRTRSLYRSKWLEGYTRTTLSTATGLYEKKTL